MESESETFDEVLRCIQNDIVHFVGKPVKHSRDLLQEYHDRFKAAHQREVAELKSKMNDVVCENEALRDACGTCGAKREREATREKSSQVGNTAKMRDDCPNIYDKAYLVGIEFERVVTRKPDGLTVIDCECSRLECAVEELIECAVEELKEALVEASLEGK